MTKEELTQGNKLIAEFMGYKEDRYPEGLPYSVDLWGPFFNNDIRYSTSWDWLMPVVEKIGKTYDVRITWGPTSLDVTYIDRPDVYEGEITSMGGMTAIENTWWCVVRFINWYNKNKKK